MILYKNNRAFNKYLIKGEYYIYSVYCGISLHLNNKLIKFLHRKGKDLYFLHNNNIEVVQTKKYVDFKNSFRESFIKSSVKEYNELVNFLKIGNLYKIYGNLTDNYFSILIND